MSLKDSIRTAVLSATIMSAFAIGSADCAAGEIIAQVTYVAKDAVYLDAGSSAGLAKGMFGEVLRGGAAVAGVEVIFVAVKSSSARLVKGEAVLVGDRVVFQTELPPAKEVRPPEKAEDVSPRSAKPIPSPSQTVKPERRTRVSGMGAVQLHLQDDLAFQNYDYAQPSGYLRLRADNIAGSGYQFRLRLRSRANLRRRDLLESASSRWETRVWEAALASGSRGGDAAFAIGRASSNRIAGVGLVDGGIIEKRLSERFRIGALAGYDPDWLGGSFTSHRTKVGAFVSYLPDRSAGTEFAGSVSLAGIYDKGVIDREFIYMQTETAAPFRIRLMQSAEIGIQRGWRRELGSAPMTVDYFSLSGARRLSDAASLSAGWDWRSSYRTSRDRQLPDSLFDDALRSSGRASLYLMLPMRSSLSVSAGVGVDDGVLSSRYSSVSVNSSDLLGVNLHSSLRVSGYSNDYTEGLQPAVSLSRRFWKGGLGASVQAGARRSRSKGLQPRDSASRWIRFDGDIQLPAGMFCAVSAEAERGGGYDANRFSLEFGAKI